MTTFEIPEDAYLAHYGILRKSGRYPWGSGESQSARNRSFLDHIEEYKKANPGISDVELVKHFNLPSTTALRAAKSIANAEQKASDIAMAQGLKDHGYSNMEIGRRMGKNESTVRSLLAPGAKDKADILETVSTVLKQQVDADGDYIQIGTGVENHLGISKDKLNTAVARLVEEGYRVHTVQVAQAGTRHKTGVKILTPPGTEYRDAVQNMDKIRNINQHSDDRGRSFSELGVQTPISIDSKRIKVRYAEEGGADADGVIHIRPGAKDLDMGGARYAQVRIAVDGSHYLKGMAIYKDDLPHGVDVVFNTNKKNTGNKLDAMKPMKDDPGNPFGSVVRQLGERDATGRLTKVTSALNLVNEEGDWEKWSKNFSSQMLSKQSPRLIKDQLDMTYERRKNEFDEIMKLTNPSVRKKLLDSFADSTDSAAIHLKAAAIPRSRNHVILPISSLKENEIHAPNFKDGERVALIRYPHGGKFEIPELTVNNRNPEAKRAIGSNAKDAVGINHKVAQRLSGADFDGDTVLVIPNNSGKIKSQKPLQGLVGFDPQHSYPPHDGMRTMSGGTWNAKTRKEEFPPGVKPSSRTKGKQMGLVSNLITDMTIKGATDSELARAVRHSMVVIDAEKHSLNYKLSAEKNGIPALMKKYQGRAGGGSSTLISKARSPERVNERKSTPRINKETGEKEWIETGNSWTDAHGKTVFAKTSIAKLAAVKDAHDLSSGTVQEALYADHSNRLKNMANQARKASVNTPSTPISASAKKHYSGEVSSLNAKLNEALKNKPLERQAQLLTSQVIEARKAANPDMDDAELKKLKGQALEEMRSRTGAKKQQIEITSSEWAAIQAGAISPSKLDQILSNSNIERIKELATPRVERKLSSSKVNRAQQMLASGYTQAEVAEHLGVSVSTLKTELSPQK